MAKRLNVISVADQRKAREESNARLDEAYKKQVKMNDTAGGRFMAVSFTHNRAHET